jgi:peptide/nickel transport system substrate-binding protein
MCKKLGIVLAVLALALGTQAVAQTPMGFFLKIGTTEDVDSLSPFTAYERAATELFMLVYDPLVSFDTNLQPSPALAESWTVGYDGLEWFFHLRKGVKWSDGKPFTSADVKFTYEAIMNSGLGLYSAFLEGITSIDTPDDLTVVIHTDKPKANMLQNPTPILPKHIWEAGSANFETFEDPALVGTGPFRLGKWKKGEYLSLTASPKYYGKYPSALGVVFTVFANRDTMAKSLDAGEIDVALGLYPDQVPELQKNEAIAVFSFSANGFTQLALNSWTDPESKGHPALRDARVRQAIEFALDKKEILAVALSGAGTVGTTLIPESTPEWHYQLPAGMERKYDPQAAKSLLDAAGYRDRNGDGVREGPDGKVLNLRFSVRSDNAREVKAGQMIQGYLKDVGIATRLSTVDDGALQDSINGADYDMFIWGWGGDVDPTTLLAILTTDQIGGNNEPRWSDPEYDDLVKRQASILDAKERKTMVDEAQRLAYEAAPYIILAYDGDIQAVRKDKIQGFIRVAGNGPVFYANTPVNYISVFSVDKSAKNGVNALIATAGSIAVLVLGTIIISKLRRKGKDTAKDKA